MHSPCITVVGGINLDITGQSFSEMILEDSNPGRVTWTYGGVGRNIAENLARMGARVCLITALGDDAHTPLIRRHCEETGIDLSYSGVILNTSSGVYLSVHDANGDVRAAVSDMAICDRITPAYLEGRLPVMNRSDLVVVEANLPQESLLYLGSHLTVPMVADPVSVKKSPRLLPLLPRLTAVKPNRPEAEVLSGVPIRTRADLEAASDAILRKGCRSVFISLGAEGVYYSDGETRGIQPCLPGKVHNTNGCGDAFLAALAMGITGGMSLEFCARLGQAASALCATSPSAVSPDMEPGRLLEMAGI